MFGKKPRQEPPPPAVAIANVVMIAPETERRDAAEAKAAEIKAILEATPTPTDVYRVSKDFETGQFSVSRWVNRLGWDYSYFVPTPYLDQGHTPFPQRFPSTKAAQAFIKALIDPATNLMGFDAKGEPVEVGK